MRHLQLFTKNELDSILVFRKGETKFGEHIKLLSNLTNIYDDIKDLQVGFLSYKHEAMQGLSNTNNNS